MFHPIMHIYMEYARGSIFLVSEGRVIQMVNKQRNRMKRFYPEFVVTMEDQDFNTILM